MCVYGLGLYKRLIDNINYSYSYRITKIIDKNKIKLLKKY